MTMSAPPRALKTTRSTLSVSMTMLATSRVNLSRSPLADSSICSATLAPLNSIVSVPESPSIVSLPSPGSHWNVSLPDPISALSLPRLPSAKSLPEPPTNLSAPEPPIIVSLPEPPSIVVGIAVGEDAAALVDPQHVVCRSRPRSRSRDVGAGEEEVGEPSPSRSTSITSGWPACSRVTIVSSPLPPSTVSSPCWSVGALSFGAASAVAIPLPATAVAAVRARIAGQTGRLVRGLGMNLFMVSPSFSVSLISIGTKDTGGVDPFPANPREYLRPRGVFQSMAILCAGSGGSALPFGVLWC